STPRASGSYTSACPDCASAPHSARCCQRVPSCTQVPELAPPDAIPPCTTIAPRCSSNAAAAPCTAGPVPALVHSWPFHCQQSERISSRPKSSAVWPPTSTHTPREVSNTSEAPARAPGRVAGETCRQPSALSSQLSSSAFPLLPRPPNSTITPRLESKAMAAASRAGGAAP